MTIKMEQQVQQYGKIAQNWGQGVRGGGGEEEAMEKYRESGEDEIQMSLLQRLQRV